MYNQQSIEYQILHLYQLYQCYVVLCVKLYHWDFFLSTFLVPRTDTFMNIYDKQENLNSSSTFNVNLQRYFRLIYLQKAGLIDDAPNSSKVQSSGFAWFPYAILNAFQKTCSPMQSPLYGCVTMLSSLNCQSLSLIQFDMTHLPQTSFISSKWSSFCSFFILESRDNLQHV